MPTAKVEGAFLRVPRQLGSYILLHTKFISYASLSLLAMENSLSPVYDLGLNSKDLIQVLLALTRGR